MRAAAGLLILCALAARAGDSTPAERLARSFPPGSITSEPQAAAALAQAAQLHRELQEAFAREQSACEHDFFVNHCMDAARTRERAGEHEVRRVTLEAHDLRRQIQAQENARARADQMRREAAEDLQRATRAQEARTAAQVRAQNAAAREQDARQADAAAAQALVHAKQRQDAQPEKNERVDAERPAAAAIAQEQFQNKQAQAQAYARSRERDRQVNAQRRAERQAAREAADAADAAAHGRPAAPAR